MGRTATSLVGTGSFAVAVWFLWKEALFFPPGFPASLLPPPFFLLFFQLCSPYLPSYFLNLSPALLSNPCTGPFGPAASSPSFPP